MRPSAGITIVCASPAVAEIVFALGCGDRVVGVSEFTDWPPEAAAKPSLGGALSPNRERILALEPDLILAQGQAEALGAFARGTMGEANGLNHLSVHTGDIAAGSAALAAAGFQPLSGFPRRGAHGTIAFFAPDAASGLRIELCQPEAPGGHGH